MQLQLRDSLPFCSVQVSFRGRSILLDDVLIDTGSARTILAADLVASIGISPEPDDALETIRGVGGTEIVYTRQVDRIGVAGKTLSPFIVEVGAMDYGFKLDGILGMDFLRRADTILDMSHLSIQFA